MERPPSFDQPPVQSKFLSEKPLERLLPRDGQTTYIAGEIDLLLKSDVFKQFKLARMGSEHLVFTLEDPKQRNAVYKVNFGLSTALVDRALQEGVTNPEVIQELCQQALKKERASQEEKWEELSKELPSALIPTRKMAIIEVPLSKALWEGVLSKVKQDVPVEAIDTPPEQIPVLVTLQRQVHAPVQDSFCLGQEWIFQKGAVGAKKLRQHFCQNEPISEQELKKAWRDAFPYLENLVNRAKADPVKFARFKEVVADMDAYMQKTRIPLDIMGSDNVIFGQLKSDGPLGLICTDPFYSKVGHSSEGMEFSLLEKALRQQAGLEERTLDSSEMSRAAILLNQVVALKTLAWLCDVPSTLQIEGIEKPTEINYFS